VLRGSRRMRVATAGLVLLSACGNISHDNGNAVEGTYTLFRAHDSPLPTALDDRIGAFTVQSGVLTLQSTGEWSEVLTGTTTDNGQTVPKQLTEGGRWTIRQLEVELVRDDGALSYFGTFSVAGGDALDLLRPAFASTRHYVYVR
jgi:hypothetical protein